MGTPKKQSKKKGTSTKPKLKRCEVKVPPRKIIIVIDPGHGDGSENLGASAITGKTKAGGIKQDYSRSERDLVMLISEKMKPLLEAKGHIVHLTRSTKKGMKLQKRNRISNAKKADYFVSMHADGGSAKSTGAHAIYRPRGDKTYDAEQREFAIDIMKPYTVVKMDHRHPDARTNLGVLNNSRNKAPFKVLVELGFASNPKEFDIIKASADKAAKELSNGIDVNIKKNWEGGCRKAKKKKAKK